MREEARVVSCDREEGKGGGQGFHPPARNSVDQLGHLQTEFAHFRWGAKLVSFLPPDVEGHIVGLFTGIQ